MRRLVSVLLSAGIAIASTTAAAPAAPVRATVVMLWTATDPTSAFADVRCLDVALRAPLEIGAPAKALRVHPGARFAIALSPAYVSAFACASADPLGAASRATGERADVRTRDVLRVLAAMPPLTASDAAARGGRDLATLTVAAQHWLAGGTASAFSPDDLRRLAALNAAARSAAVGSVNGRSLLAQPPSSTAALFRAANELVRGEADDAASAARDAVARGALEFVATPNGAPVLPLLVDSGGRTMSDPSVLPLNATADAALLIDDAVAGAASMDGGHGTGLLSPFGAYDDASAQLIAARGAHYAIFSDRVLQTSQAGGSVAALRAAQASPYLVYGLQIAKSSTLPIYFWADEASRALDAFATTLPPDSFASRVMADAGAAGATSSDGSPRVLVVSVDFDAPWSLRPDAAAVVDRVAVALARWGAVATPHGYLGSHRAFSSVYGFAPGSTVGPLDAFTALANQTSMWSALAQARNAAGGDAALHKPAVRDPLLRAESGYWFLTPTLPLGTAALKGTLDDFRSDLRDVYTAAGKPAPALIAPMRPSTPPPAPRPSASPAPAPGPAASPTPSPNHTTGSYPQGL
jgi:hypothetical protein